jgi:translation initiation factor eIF-2B subunit epsilon
MSHKGKNSASSAKGKKPAKSNAESKTEDVLQAVVRTNNNSSRGSVRIQQLTMSLSL